MKQIFPEGAEPEFLGQCQDTYNMTSYASRTVLGGCEPALEHIENSTSRREGLTPST